MKITEDLIGLLIQLVHGNTNGKKFMAKEFHAHHLKMHHREENFVELMNLSIELKINEIAEYRSCTEAGPMFGKSCWNVRPDVMKQFDVLEVKLPNEWEYTLTKPVNNKSKAKKSLLVDGDETAEDIGKKETKIRKVEKVAEVSCFIKEYYKKLFSFLILVPKTIHERQTICLQKDSQRNSCKYWKIRCKTHLK